MKNGGDLIIGARAGLKYAFVLNYDSKPKKIFLHAALVDMDTKESVSGEVMLIPYETKVYKYQ